MERRTWNRCVALCSAGAWLVAGALAAAPFTNGSFEVGPTPPPGSFINLVSGDTSISGWTVLPANIDYIGTYWTAADGSRSLDLSGTSSGGIAQTFDTVAGTQYNVTFYLAGNPECAPTVKTLQVSATGSGATTYTFDTTGHSLSSMGWQVENYMFVATGASTTLSFQSQVASACGPALDNVSVTAVPPIPALSPALVAVLALICVAAGWIALGR